MQVRLFSKKNAGRIDIFQSDLDVQRNEQEMTESIIPFFEIFDHEKQKK